MRFIADNDEIMVQDTLDRILREARDSAVRRDGHAPRPDPAALRSKLSELGLWGGWLPESAGGADGGPRLLMTLARVLGGYPSYTDLIENCVFPACLLEGSDNKKAQSLLPRIIEGDTPVALACLEPGRRWELRAERMRVELDDEGGIQLSGVKTHVAGASKVEMFIVTAAESDGTSLFIVASDAPGITVETFPALDGSIWATVRMDNVQLTEDARLTTPELGLALLNRAKTLASFAAAAEILGSCEVLMTQTLDYMRTREQFGHTLASNQALQFRTADLHTDIEMLRSLVLGAANTLSQGWTARASSDVAGAMALAVETGDLVAREAIHLHGAIGMTRELGIGYHLMRVDVLTRWLGDAAHFREIFLATEQDQAA